MVAKRTIKAPDWVDEKELLSLLLSHAATKHEYFASRNRVFETKYGSDYTSFKKRVEEAQDESFTQWDDMIAWESLEAASEQWKTRYEELLACLKS
mgnify:CR=1 FL=1